jgi:DNA-binding NtrC family response regulator
VFRRCGGSSPRSSGCPIPEGDNAQQAVREGALGLLSKPFTLTELLAWIDRAQSRTGSAGRS